MLEHFSLQINDVKFTCTHTFIAFAIRPPCFRAHCFQDGLFDAIGAAQHATDCARVMAADVQTLLRMPFDLFWAHVLFDPSVKTVRAFWNDETFVRASVPRREVLPLICVELHVFVAEWQASFHMFVALPESTRAIFTVRVPHSYPLFSTHISE